MQISNFHLAARHKKQDTVTTPHYEAANKYIVILSGGRNQCVDLTVLSQPNCFYAYKLHPTVYALHSHTASCQVNTMLFGITINSRVVFK
jgi:hypothetical protein